MNGIGFQFGVMKRKMLKKAYKKMNPVKKHTHVEYKKKRTENFKKRVKKKRVKMKIKEIHKCTHKKKSF